MQMLLPFLVLASTFLVCATIRRETCCAFCIDLLLHLFLILTAAISNTSNRPRKRSLKTQTPAQNVRNYGKWFMLSRSTGTTRSKCCHARTIVTLKYNKESRWGSGATGRAAQKFAEMYLPFERVKEQDFAPKNCFKASTSSPSDSTSVTRSKCRFLITLWTNQWQSYCTKKP